MKKIHYLIITFLFLILTISGGFYYLNSYLLSSETTASKINKYIYTECVINTKRVITFPVQKELPDLNKTINCYYLAGPPLLNSTVFEFGSAPVVGKGALYQAWIFFMVSIVGMIVFGFILGTRMDNDEEMVLCGGGGACGGDD